MNQFRDFKTRFLKYYEAHETRADIGFFLGGVLFDILTLSEIDDLFSILQQTIYLLVIGAVLVFDFLEVQIQYSIPNRIKKAWPYRHLLAHFLMGSLLSLYSLFFLKSSSFFTSFGFIFFILTLLVANETKTVQKSAFNFKTALFVVCLFSFFSMMYPVVLGFVGWLPFALSCATSLLALYGIFYFLKSKIADSRLLLRALWAPGGSILVLFSVFYLLGWIPPVPLSVQNMGVFHKVERRVDKFELSFEKAWWQFWRSSDSEFVAEPGDRLHFFARIFAPGRFDDSVTLHWLQRDEKRGWLSTDRISMRIFGGRKGGYRGFAVKQNFTEGDWRVQVETTDGREIGRYYFRVKKSAVTNPDRIFTIETY